MSRWTTLSLNRTLLSTRSSGCDRAASADGPLEGEQAEQWQHQVLPIAHQPVAQQENRHTHGCTGAFQRLVSRATRHKRLSLQNFCLQQARMPPRDVRPIVLALEEVLPHVDDVVHGSGAAQPEIVFVVSI